MWESVVRTSKDFQSIMLSLANFFTDFFGGTVKEAFDNVNIPVLSDLVKGTLDILSGMGFDIASMSMLQFMFSTGLAFWLTFSLIRWFTLS